MCELTLPLAHVVQRSDKDPFCEESIFAMILVATTDFDIFMAMMREAAQKKARKGK
jgi:hypothetical protein